MAKISSKHLDSTEYLIESLHASRRSKSILVNPDYLDDEKLPDDQRSAVLKEIFNKNIREKQLSRIISHLSPVLDGAHPESALVYGPTGSGKTVSLIHVLSSFSEVSRRHFAINWLKIRYVRRRKPDCTRVRLLPWRGGWERNPNPFSAMGAHHHLLTRILQVIK